MRLGCPSMTAKNDNGYKFYWSLLSRFQLCNVWVGVIACLTFRNNDSGKCRWAVLLKVSEYIGQIVLNWGFFDTCILLPDCCVLLKLNVMTITLTSWEWKHQRVPELRFRLVCVSHLSSWPENKQFQHIVKNLRNISYSDCIIGTKVQTGYGYSVQVRIIFGRLEVSVSAIMTGNGWIYWKLVDQ